MPLLRLRTLCLALAVGVGSACVRGEASTSPAAPALGRPRLAVVLVVDQMRADYLTRYADLYRGGLARLRRDGAWFTDGHIQHALTYTAPGHASAATGTHPAHHGIIDNNWFDRSAGAELYAVEDPRSPTAGDLPGRSPRQLERLALGDWLKAQEPAARVLSVALKDRAAILMGGRRPDRAYWYSHERAGFVSSSWYADQAPLPAWVNDFNASGAVLAGFARGWTRLREFTAYLRSGPDRVDAEADGVHTQFPHLFDDGTPAARAAFPEKLLETPFGDQLALQFARAAISAEQLGADAVPDLLMLSCSSADLIGHAYGPDSHEIEDYYLRLDAQLGELFTYLDEHVGKDSWVLALTADHGAQPLPEEAAQRGHPTARRVTAEVYRAQATSAISGALTRLGLDPQALRHLSHDAVWLAAPAGGAVTPAQQRAAVAAALRELDFIADAFTAEELAGPADPARLFLDKYQRSYFAARSPDVQLRFKEWHLVDADPQGTSHGSPYRYDTHVPVLFYGAGVRPGVHAQPVGTVDVAPTLADLLGVAKPVELDGRSLAPGISSVIGR